MIPNLLGGGAERVAQQIGTYFTGEGIKVYYFLLRKARGCTYEVFGEIINLDIEEGLNNVFERTDLRRLKKEAKRIQSRKEELSIDVAISFMEEANYLNILSRCKEKVIVSVRTTLSMRDDLGGLFYNRAFIRRLYNKADKVVAVSEFTKNDLIDNYGIDSRKVVSIPNAPTDLAGDLSLEWKYGSHAIVCVSRFEPVKQHDHIIRAFSQVKKNVPSAELILCGEGKLRDYLQYICRKLELEKNVHFVGFCNDMTRYYSNSRVFVMASFAEGFPNSMVEAMKYGCPIVSVDTPGGVRDILEVDNTIEDVTLCKYGVVTPLLKGKAPRSLELTSEESKLAEAMTRILTDDDLFRMYKERSLERADHYSYDRIMKRWKGIIE